LSISPRRKRLRSVPFSRMISARLISAGSLMSSAPPSPQVTFLVWWKLRVASAPSDPSGTPRQRANRPCALSSMSIAPLSSPRRPSRSQGTPA
jgi:hypothetical protein